MANDPSTFRFLGKVRRSRLIDLREKVTPVLSNRIHTHFTDHSVAHSDRVAKLAEELAAPLKHRLDSDEAFVLYAAAYLHDVGMQNENAWQTGIFGERVRKRAQDWTKTPREEKLRLIRQYHHEISADMVVASVRSGSASIGLSLTEEDQPGSIAAICEAHGVATGSERYRQLTEADKTPSMRLRLLSALLRLADILDEVHYRALHEQLRTLDPSLESRMHWWRLYYTRDVEVELKRNRVTVWFEFPESERDEYTRIVVPLQMPEIEQELLRHREVLAENSLSWHIGWQVKRPAHSTLETMPPEVKDLMLKEVARRKRLAAEESRLDFLRQFDNSRAHLLKELHLQHQCRDAKTAEDYQAVVLKLTRDLWKIESRSTAWQHLSSAYHFATVSNHSVQPSLHLEAAIELGRMMAQVGLPADGLRILVHAREIASSLPDEMPAKAEYYRWLASVAFRAGYDGDAASASKVAMRLLPPGLAKELFEAELAEARLLVGDDLRHPEGEE